MEELVEIRGGIQLKGSVEVGGAKNAVLPMLIASLLTSEPCTFYNVPAIRDVFLTIDLLRHFGAVVDYNDRVLRVQTKSLEAVEASYSLVKSFRASFWVLGPLLARGGCARVALPGGDIIGARPVDMHLEALTKMGADINVKGGVVYATAPNGLQSAEIELRFPSVGATHQILLAASLTEGTTVIRGAAREPEISAVCDLLSEMGAEVQGAGSSEIKIIGKDFLYGATQRLIGDRIEAATFALAAVATRGVITISGFCPSFFGSFSEILIAMGVELTEYEGALKVDATSDLLPVSVCTEPFPGLATDIQALLMAALTTIPGKSVIEESIFEGRFGHVAELCRMGADIKVKDRIAEISGGKPLSGAPVEALDIRAAAALVIAGHAAKGLTQIHEPFHLSRGYDSLISKFQSLGGNLRLCIADPEDFMSVGC